MANKKPFKVKHLPLLLLYICLEKSRHPIEIATMFGREYIKSSYDRDISKYFNMLESEGLVISKFEDNKKYFETNVSRLAELIISDHKGRLKMLLEEDKKMLESIKEKTGKDIKPIKRDTKIPTKEEAIENFKKLFDLTYEPDKNKTTIWLLKSEGVQPKDICKCKECRRKGYFIVPKSLEKIGEIKGAF